VQINNKIINIKNMKKKTGFTLFELLVSISIIAILTALATVSYSSAQKKARDARRMEDMANIQKAAEMYYSQNKYSYPAGTGDFTDAAKGAVLQAWPTDPKPASWVQYSYAPDVPAVGGYCACAKLDNATGGNASDGSCTFAASSQYYCVKNQQ
jgi:prepilin-type N-terminal cleavage/methylation domain-containing protein